MCTADEEEEGVELTPIREGPALPPLLAEAFLSNFGCESFLMFPNHFLRARGASG